MIRVLIAEDEPPIAKSLATLLEMASGEIETIRIVINGKRALETLKEYKADLLFTDIRMPVMDGLVLSEAVRERHPNIVTIVVSGFQEFDYAVSAMKSGVFDYLLKPISMESVAEALAKAIPETRERKLRISWNSVAAPNARTEPLHGLRRAAADEEELAEELSRVFAMTEGTEESRGCARKLCEDVARYLRGHYRENVTGADLSRAFGIPAVRLSREFKNHFGVSMSAFLNRYRIEAAKRLLKSGRDVLVKEAAASVGFNDQYYFSKTFKKITGEWPTEYLEKGGHKRNESSAGEMCE